jgi:hypothetical protein
MFLDGSINGDWFEVYVAHVLTPTQRPGDIVMMDTFSSHKRASVKAIIEAAVADLWFLPPYGLDFKLIEMARQAQGAPEEGRRARRRRTLDPSLRAIFGKEDPIMGRASTAKKSEARDAASKLAQSRLSVIELAKELGNVAEAYLDLNGVEHRRTKVRTPKTNGFVEQFNGTVLDEFFRVKMRETFYETVDALQADLDAWLIHYNTERPHLGYCMAASDTDDVELCLAGGKPLKIDVVRFDVMLAFADVATSGPIPDF